MTATVPRFRGAVKVAPIGRASTSQWTLVLERVYRWRLRLVFAPHLAARDTAYKRAIFEFFPEPLYLSQVDEFKWYCRARRDLDQCRLTLTQTEAERYAKARRTFSSRRFCSAYREWLTGSDLAKFSKAPNRTRPCLLYIA